MLTWTEYRGPNEESMRVASDDGGHHVYRVVPNQGGRGFRLEKRDGAFWWPLLGDGRRHGVPLARTWGSPDAAMHAAELERARSAWPEAG